MAIRGCMNLASYDRLFPSQDLLPVGGVGNLIPAPLFRPARRTARPAPRRAGQAGRRGGVAGSFGLVLVVAGQLGKRRLNSHLIRASRRQALAPAPPTLNGCG